MKPVVAALLFGIAGCAHEVAPVAEPPPTPPRPVVIKRTIIRPQSPNVVEGVTVGSPTAAAIREFRKQEAGAKAARSYPNATRQQLHDINETEIKARDALQRQIDKDGHNTTLDRDQTHDAIDALGRAQQAPKEEAQ